MLEVSDTTSGILPLPILPAVFDLTATSAEDIDVARGAQVVQGQSFELPIQILDENGDPFDGSGFDGRAQLREDVADFAGSILADFTFVWVDAALGACKIKLTPTQTTALKVDGGRWDLELENVSDPGYDVGFVQRVFKGAWTLDREVTAE